MKNKLIQLLLIVTLSFSICGCTTNLNNTPTKQAEIFLGKYQTLHEDVITDLDRVVAEEVNFASTQRDKYRSIMKKHYQELEYEIKDERIDGDKATVTVEIEVDDYTKVLKEATDKLSSSPEEFNDDKGNYNHGAFIDYQLDKMDKVKDRISYTLELTFTKRDKSWVIDNLSSTDMDKINGTYIY